MNGPDQPCAACERARRLMPGFLAGRLRALELRRLETKWAKRATKARIRATEVGIHATEVGKGGTPPGEPVEPGGG